MKLVGTMHTKNKALCMILITLFNWSFLPTPTDTPTFYHTPVNGHHKDTRTHIYMGTEKREGLGRRERVGEGEVVVGWREQVGGRRVEERWVGKRKERWGEGVGEMGKRCLRAYLDDCRVLLHVGHSSNAEVV